MMSTNNFLCYVGFVLCKRLFFICVECVVSSLSGHAYSIDKFPLGVFPNCTMADRPIIAVVGIWFSSMISVSCCIFNFCFLNGTQFKVKDWLKFGFQSLKES